MTVHFFEHKVDKGGVKKTRRGHDYVDIQPGVLKHNPTPDDGEYWVSVKSGRMADGKVRVISFEFDSVKEMVEFLMRFTP